MSAGEVFAQLRAAASPELRAWLQARPQTVLAVIARVDNLLLGPAAAYADMRPSKAEGMISASKLEDFKRRIAALQKKTAKHGLPPIMVAYGQPQFVKLPQKDWEVELGIAPRYEQQIPVSLDMPAVQIKGWRFLATVDHRSDGTGPDKKPTFHNIIKLAPGVGSLSSAYRTAGPHCDHCKTQRWRKETFVLEKDGRQVRVGRQCLRDFIGHEDAETLILLAQTIDDLRGAVGEDSEFGGGGSDYDAAVRVERALVRAAQAVNTYGYVSRKQAEAQNIESTADTVSFALFPPRNAPREKLPPPPSPADEALGKAALAWVRSAPGDSDFMYNVRTAAAQDYTYARDLGLLVAIIPAYERAQGILREGEGLPPGAHLGKVGDRFGGAGKKALPPLEAVITKRRVLDGTYGTTTLLGMRTPEGADLLWFATGVVSPMYGEGKRVRVTGTVKAHIQDKLTGRPVTQLTRGEIELI